MTPQEQARETAATLGALRHLVENTGDDTEKRRKVACGFG